MTSRPRPPGSPPAFRLFGDYCFRARCNVSVVAGGCPVGVFTGFDRGIDVGTKTVSACRLHVRTLTGGSMMVCDPDPEVVMISHTTMECSGQMFFELGGQTTRVV